MEMPPRSIVMKSFNIAVFALLPGAVAFGTPADRAILAAMRLGEQQNYSWTTSVTDDARTYEVSGKTSKAGYTWVRLPMVKALAQRLGRDAEPDIEAVFRSNDHFVIRADGSWMMVEELPRRHPDWIDRDYWVVGHSTRVLHPSLGSGIGFHDPLDPFAHDPLDPFGNDPFPPLLAVPVMAPGDEKRPYSNAQFGLSRPHDELAVIVSSHESMEVRGDTAAGVLTDLGAQLLLVREGQNNIQPVVAGGMFQMTIQNGIVTRYDLRLEGILYVDKKRVHVRQGSRTSINNIGSTYLNVPEDARRVLDGERLLAQIGRKR
jgi:hypothetical protein